jgi:hypothetical protein
LEKKINRPGKTSMMMRVGKSLLGRFFLILALITMGLGIMPVQGVRAANLAVTNKNDSGPGSLRRAIADAGGGNLLTFGLSRAELAIQVADGDLDTTFGTNGIVTTDFDNGVDYSTSVVLQPDAGGLGQRGVRLRRLLRRPVLQLQEQEPSHHQARRVLDLLAVPQSGGHQDRATGDGPMKKPSRRKKSKSDRPYMIF